MGHLNPTVLDLSPAKWIWLPSQRTLANTFVLFRKDLELPVLPARVAGWITADSRYRLTVNGERVQWGPAPADPRWWDVDPVEITRRLRPGPNTIGVEVLYYGHGDGTWPIGKPGLLMRLEITQPDGRIDVVGTDESWQCCVDRAHPPGQYRRWYLRALQEQFDARLHPHGWDRPGFAPDARWLPAMLLPGRADRPPMCSWYGDYLRATEPLDEAQAELRARQIPMLIEEFVPARLADSGQVVWHRDPADWFEFRTPGAFEIVRTPSASAAPSGFRLEAPTAGATAVYATFELAEQVVGWPAFTIDAPAGTVVEVMVQESHDLAVTPWLDTHFHAWSRFICREGENRFEAFDFESLRWLQVHVRDASGPVTLRDLGVRRRRFPWANPPRIRCAEPGLQALFDASLNTLNNSAQETIMDGAGRERQQYSGDAGLQIQAIYYSFGETRQPERFIRTFSQGSTLDGYFLDCWPAYDRLSRLSQRHVGATRWGPILDHSIQFVFDCLWHYQYTGELGAVAEAYPRLRRFAEYLIRLRAERGDHGLLPVENAALGMPSVWIDHDAYQQQRHKQCAFNLYAAAMYRQALPKLLEAFGESGQAPRYLAEADAIEAATVARFWCPERRTFVNNLPWLSADGAPRLCDRSLATALLFDQCPGGDTAASVRWLDECPVGLGISYPCNAGWRYWALARHGRIGTVIADFRTRWASMASVRLNNTLQETWQAAPDTAEEWSHCPLAPLYVLYMSILGIRSTTPGFATCDIRPQLGDLGDLDVVAYTVKGPIGCVAKRTDTGHALTLSVPDQIAAELILPVGAEPGLPRLYPDHPLGLQRYRLPSGQSVTLVLASAGERTP